MVLRTVDKLRYKLAGGKSGGYTIRGMNTALPGLSLVLLDGIGVSEERLLEVVAGASVEDEVAQWLRQNANLSQTESLNSKLHARRIEDVLALLPLATGIKFYPFLKQTAQSPPFFHLLFATDRL